VTEGDPDDSPEYFQAKTKWIEYWKLIHQGLQDEVYDDPAVAIARLVRQFGIFEVETEIVEHIWNLPSIFEQRWRERREARVRDEKEAKQRARNPNRAGRGHQRSEIVLMSVWLTVQRTMQLKRTNVVDACKLLVKAPSRREATRWPGLLIYHEPHKRAYYVRTPTNLRDIYNDAVKYYSAGSEGLKRHWETNLETFLRLGGAV
jgi:hypothetical protein